MSEITLPTWTHRAASLPLAFAQVREDPRLDLAVVSNLRAGATVVMIASGGETACCLSRATLERLHVVDVNPAQLALTQLKLGSMHQFTPTERLQLLGHLSISPKERKHRLTQQLDALGLSWDVLGPLDWVAEVGPDQAGRYEQVFVQLNHVLHHHTEAPTNLLTLADPIEQRHQLNAWRPVIESAFAEVMSLPNLVHLFGLEATRNPARPFAEHFAERTCATLAQASAGSNPFLWQMLLGRFPKDHPYDWLTLERSTQRGPEVICTLGRMHEVLEGIQAQSCDLVHLSNILDWLSPEEAIGTLRGALHALKPGGRVLVRQLNSTLDIEGLPTEFQWDRAAGLALLERDRSFFYKAIHLGRKP